MTDDLLLTFYGDDFSGSTDSMEVLAKAGLRTLLFLKPPTPKQLSRYEGLRAVGVAGISRSLSPEELEAELPPIFAALKALNAPLFHVKICSTFDSSPTVGSIGRTIEIGQRVFPGREVLLIVGAPNLGRFVIFGSLFARYSIDAPHVVYRLDLHPTMRRHPVTPMHEADLLTHLRDQTEQTMANINVLMLEGSEVEVDTRVQEVLFKERPNILLFDTLTATHLQTVGRLLWKQAQAAPPLFCIGSSGVEYALTAHWQSQTNFSSSAPGSFHVTPVDRLVVVSGSASPVSAEQIEWAVANGFADIALDMVRLLLPSEAAEEEAKAITLALSALENGRSVVLHTCKGPEDPRLAATASLLTAGRESGKLIGGLLGRILHAILMRSGVRRAVVAGGDTSGYVAQELGIEALETAMPMSPGSPLCRAYAPGSPLDGMEILFKGGQVGRIDIYGDVKKGFLQ